MRLVSVNVSMPREIPIGDGTVRTGIFKRPVASRIQMRRLGLQGDGQADLEFHGGIYKAVYAYPHEHYPAWSGELGRDDLLFGQFGENLTVEGLLEEEVWVGDLYRMGDALVEVTQPRVPCSKLGLRMGWPDFPRRFLKSLRSGFYLRVLEEGEVGAGDAVHRMRRDPESMSIRELNRLRHFDGRSRERLERARRIAALSPRWKDAFAELVSSHDRAS